MKNSIPLLLSIIILSFTTNTAFAQPPAYLFGYNLAFHATTTSQCNIYSETDNKTGAFLSTPDFVHCITGFNNAQSNIGVIHQIYSYASNIQIAGDGVTS